MPGVASPPAAGVAPGLSLPLTAAVPIEPRWATTAAAPQVSSPPHARGAKPGPAGGTDQVPPAPGGGSGSGASASSAGTSTGLALGLLLVLLTLPCLRFGTLQLAPARWRPVLFVSLLERPG